MIIYNNVNFINLREMAYKEIMFTDLKGREGLLEVSPVEYNRSISRIIDEVSEKPEDYEKRMKETFGDVFPSYKEYYGLDIE